MAKVVVGKAEEIGEGKMTHVTAGGKEVLPKASKHDLAIALLARIEVLRRQKPEANKPGARRR